MLRRTAFILSLTLFVWVSAAGKRTVILISIDGFRADYFELHQPPTINELAANGVRARWLKPVYPTKTFPAHYSLVTGLYPDNHGIVENNMFDPAAGGVFGLARREAVTDPRWWGGEPVWNTAQRQGLTAAAFFWPGTETLIGGMQPKLWRVYDGKIPNDARVDTVLGWLDLPEAERPSFITMYFSDVDEAGHAHGPLSVQTREAVQHVDAMVRRLADGLQTRGILNDVHLILVSDHGMAPYKMRDAIVLDKIFDVGDAERIFWVGEFTQIFPKTGKEDAIYRSIKAKLPKNARIYRRDEFPKRFKFGKNKRIAPLVVVPDEGIVITTRKRMQDAADAGKLDEIRGGHGYDNRLVSMRAMFVGHGARFRKGYLSKPLETVDVYELICELLDIKPAENDGKLSRIRKVLR